MRLLISILALALAACLHASRLSPRRSVRWPRRFGARIICTQFQSMVIRLRCAPPIQHLQLLLFLSSWLLRYRARQGKQCEKSPWFVSRSPPLFLQANMRFSIYSRSICDAGRVTPERLFRGTSAAHASVVEKLLGSGGPSTSDGDADCEPFPDFTKLVRKCGIRSVILELSSF